MPRYDWVMLDNLSTRRRGRRSMDAVRRLAAALDNLPGPGDARAEPRAPAHSPARRRKRLTREPRILVCSGKGGCGREISPDETAFLRPGDPPMVRCSGCAPRPLDAASWDAPRPCDWCARPLRVATIGARRRRRTFCDYGCQTDYYSARQTARVTARRALTRESRPCLVCGTPFTPRRRRDASSCSAACRQRRYRLRRAQAKADG
jgi:hypothetical protein